MTVASLFLSVALSTHAIAADFGACTPRAELSVAEEREMLSFAVCSKPSPHIRVCHNRTRGLVQVTSDDSVERAMMLRVGGPHPQTALFRRSHTAANAWTAAFRVCREGNYSANVMLIALDPFTNFSDPDPPANTLKLGFAQRCTQYHNYTNVLAAPGRLLREPHVFHVAALDRPPSLGRPSCELCLWSWNESAPWHTSGGSHVLRDRERIEQMLDPSREQLVGNMYDSGNFLSFQHTDAVPEAVQKWLQSRKRHEGHTGLDSSRLCLFGDSHMRNLANALVKMVDTTCDESFSRRNKSVCPESKEILTFYPTQSSAILHQRWQRFKRGRHSNCSAVLLGFGQWALSFEYRTIGPRSLVQYSREMERAMDWLQAVQSSAGVPVAWFSAYAAALTYGNSLWRPTAGSTMTMKKSLSCPPKEWRLPHLIERYNEAARARATQSNVTYIDAWELTFDVHDITCDGLHFGLEPVGSRIAELVIHWVHHARARRVVKVA